MLHRNPDRQVCRAPKHIHQRERSDHLQSEFTLSFRQVSSVDEGSSIDSKIPEEEQNAGSTFGLCGEKGFNGNRRHLVESVAHREQIGENVAQVEFDQVFMHNIE